MPSRQMERRHYIDRHHPHRQKPPTNRNPPSTTMPSTNASNGQSGSRTLPSRPFHNGVYCPLITPFTADEQIDIPALQKQVIRMASAGMGIVLLGTNGEGEFRSSHPRTGHLIYIYTLPHSISSVRRRTGARHHIVAQSARLQRLRISPFTSRNRRWFCSSHRRVDETGRGSRRRLLHRHLPGILCFRHGEE